MVAEWLYVLYAEKVKGFVIETRITVRTVDKPFIGNEIKWRISK